MLSHFTVRSNKLWVYKRRECLCYLNEDCAGCIVTAVACGVIFYILLAAIYLDADIVITNNPFTNINHAFASLDY